MGGGVIETLDALIDSNVKVCAEVLMEIHHNLMGNCTLQEIEKIYSKPEVFAQCRNWLSATFKDAQTIPVASTARAAQLAAEEPRAAAIGSSTGEDKTAMLFSTAHKAGALADVLDVFKRFGINMTNIESRPSRKRQWEYYFFVDFLGHRTEKHIQEGMEESRKHCLQLSILGSFPRATELL